MGLVAVPGGAGEMSAAVAGRPARSVLVVGGAPDLRLLLRLALERDGDIRVVAEARDGPDGVDLARRAQPDVVLLDLAGPRPDDDAVVREVRAACPTARVLVFSGLDSAGATEAAVRAGAHGSLQKGAPPSVLRASVRSAGGADDPVVPAPRGSRPDDLRGQRGPVVGPHPAHPLPGPSAASRAADLAGTGLLLVEDVDAEVPTLGYLNRAAASLLGLTDMTPGRALATAAPAVFLLLKRRLADLQGATELGDVLVGPQGRLEVRLTRSHDEEVLVAVHPPLESDDAARLRQAISTTVHEIRNPVTVITGAAAMMREPGPAVSASQQRSLLEAVERQALVLDRVTEDLLTAAQATGDSLRLEVTSVPVAPLLADAVADLGLSDSFEIRVAGDVRARADATRLRQMVANLLTNAVKYGAPPYAAQAGLARGPGGPQVVIAVTDGGPGVDADFRDRLFDQFTRAHGTGSPGTGLGLFVVRSLAQAQHGTVDYDPRPEGGSIFTITLPEA